MFNNMVHNYDLHKVYQILLKDYQLLILDQNTYEIFLILISIISLFIFRHLLLILIKLIQLY